ncbi:Nucleoporin-like protein 2 [Coemansia sp. IMI 203386]|nr:Nucleoporin-like protein 2 [Coemansia sp. IMI 203386]
MPDRMSNETQINRYIGKCNFGTRCRNEHPQNKPSAFGQSASQSLMQGGGSTPNNNRFGALSGGFGQQNAPFGAFANKQGNTTTTQAAAATTEPKYAPLSAKTLSDGLSDRPLWKLSVYGPKYNKPNVLSGTDVSPEEMHLDFVNAAKTNELPACEAKYRQLEQQVDARITEIKNNSAENARQWEAQYGEPEANTGGSGFGNKPAFGAFGSTGGFAAFGQNTGNTVFGTPSKTSAFGGSNTASAFGQNTGASAFGQNTGASAFGQSTGASAFGQITGTAAFGTPSKTSGFGFGNTNSNNNNSASAFGTPSKPSAFGASNAGGSGSGFGTGSAFGAGVDAVFGNRGNANSPKFSEAETRPLRDLLQEEIAMYRAASFIYGSIPEQAPTADLV